jgi:hypothetical protein
MKKTKSFIFAALLSIFSISASAAVINVNPGGDVAAALSICESGDIIELSAEGTYYWNSQINPKEKTFTIRAKAGLTSRPIIEAGTAVNFGFTYTTSQTVAGSATQTFDGITFDGMMRATTFFIIKDALGSNTDLVINNCRFTGIANPTTPANITALTYSNSAPSPNPNNLTITNSVFLFNGEGVFVGNGKGRPKYITVTNCFFKGVFVRTFFNSGTYKVTLWKFDHNTFEGNNGQDMSIWANCSIKNCTFSNNISRKFAGDANAFGTGGNLKTNCALYYLVGDGYMFPTDNFDATIVRTNPKLDANGFATASEYLGKANDGKPIGFYKATGLTVEVVNASTTGLISTRSDATLNVSQQANGFTVSGISNAKYAVYTVGGSQVATGVIVGGEFQMATNKGIYILKTNGKVAKFAVK